MKFKVDENIPAAVYRAIASAGHDVANVFDENLQGAPDPEIAEACREEGRSIVTLDLGFGDINVYPPSEYAGIVVLRPPV